MGRRNRRPLPAGPPRDAPARLPHEAGGLQIQAASFSGPLPPPGILAQYDALVPGSANRILTQWETQTNHRQSLELRVVESNVANARHGQQFAFILAVLILLTAVGLFATGRDIWGLIALIGEITGLTGVFIFGRRRQEQERREKFGNDKP